MDSVLIGTRIKTALDGRRQAEVASRAGITAAYLSEIVRGIKTPKLETLALIAGALDTTVSYLIGESTQIRPGEPDPHIVVSLEQTRAEPEDITINAKLDRLKRIFERLAAEETPDTYAQIEASVIEMMNRAKREIYERAEWHPPDADIYLMPEPHELLGGIVARVFPQRAKERYKKAPLELSTRRAANGASA